MTACRVEGCGQPVHVSRFGNASTLCTEHQHMYARGLLRARSAISEAARRSWAERKAKVPPKPKPEPKRAVARSAFDGPAEVDIDPDDVAIWPDSTGNLTRGFALNLRNPNVGARQQRIEAAGGHVIATVKFGRDRLTTCAGCDFEATGRTDDEMAERWNAHPREMRPLGRRSGPVEIVRAGVPQGAAA